MRLKLGIEELRSAARMAAAMDDERREQVMSMTETHVVDQLREMTRTELPVELEPVADDPEVVAMRILARAFARAALRVLAAHSERPEA